MSSSSSHAARIGNACLLLALSSWLVALACPAVVVDMGAWNRPESHPVPGYLCLVYGFWFLPSNVVLVVAPLLVRIIAHRYHALWPHILLGVLLLVSGIAALAILPLFRSVHAGYVLWVAAFFLGAMGIPLRAYGRRF